MGGKPPSNQKKRKTQILPDEALITHITTANEQEVFFVPGQNPRNNLHIFIGKAEKETDTDLNTIHFWFHFLENTL